MIALGIILAGLPFYFIFVHTKCMPRRFYDRLGKSLAFLCINLTFPEYLTLNRLITEQKEMLSCSQKANEER